MNEEQLQLAQSLSNTIVELMQKFTEETGLIFVGGIRPYEVGKTETLTRFNYVIDLYVVGDTAVRI